MLWNKICAKDLEDHVLQAAWLLTKKSSVYSFNALLRREHFLPLLPQFPLPHNLNEIWEQKCSRQVVKSATERRIRPFLLKSRYEFFKRLFGNLWTFVAPGNDVLPRRHAKIENEDVIFY